MPSSLKVLFDHPWPFGLAHGGFQIQIEQTKAGLEAAGVEVDWLRWWDTSQTASVIHYFGRPVGAYIDMAHRKGIQVVVAELLSGLGSRSALSRLAQKTLIRGTEALLPKQMTVRMAWDAYRLGDAFIANTPWEAHLMHSMFGAPPERVHCVPNGIEELFLQGTPELRGFWLVSTATITERKRVLELSQAAIEAQTPIWVVGRSYSDTDAYAQRFNDLARKHPTLIRYEGAVEDRRKLAQVYREARGFVLLSTMETLSLSAFEAAACECPLLLSDLPWARSTFGSHASYCPITSISATARILRRFYDEAPQLPRPTKPKPWVEIGRQLRAIYEGLLDSPS